MFANQKRAKTFLYYEMEMEFMYDQKAIHKLNFYEKLKVNRNHK